MTFEETLAQVRELLEREGRVAYRVLKRRFSIDDEYVEDLKADLIDAKQIAADEDGKVLVWVGNTEEDTGKLRADNGRKGETDTHDPSRWTPPHLAERIRAAVITDG